MDNYLGEIRMVGFGYAPSGWQLCNGQTLAISQYNALFALLGTTYGGNGTTSFQLPNLQGRVPLAVGSGPGLPTYVWGQQGGSSSVTLTTQNMPAHTHLVNVNTANASVTTPTATSILSTTNNADGRTPTPYPTYAPNTANGTLAPNALQPIGSNLPFSVQAPYLAVYFIIAMQGVFPSRN